jgi:hypothetical protein
LGGYWEEYNMVQGLKLVLFLLILVVPLSSFAGDSAPTLTVTTVRAHLYPRQDNESKFIATLEKGENLHPLAQGVGNEAWYMVQTSKGMIGWVQATDVSIGNRVDETFRDTSEVTPVKQPTGFLSECLAVADETYKDKWKRTCRVNDLGSECKKLPTEIADSLMRDHRAARDECIKLHTTKSITGK